MRIRQYKSTDTEEIYALFYKTVHRANAEDYTHAQLDAWAPACADLEKWRRSLAEHHTLVAVEGNLIVGFGDIAADGYLDRLYVLPDSQRQGVASAIAEQLEGYAAEKGVRKIRVFVSITAKPFFLQRGYRLLRENRVTRADQVLINYEMEKILP